MSALDAAKALVNRQPAAYNAAPHQVHATGGRMDAGHSGATETPLTGKIDTRRVNRGSGRAGTFASMAGQDQKISKDEDMSKMELEVPILHDATPWTGAPKSFFNFTMGMPVWSILNFGKVPTRMKVPGTDGIPEGFQQTAAITMVNIMSVNHMLMQSRDWEKQTVANRLLAPDSNGPGSLAAISSSYTGSYFDVYEPTVGAFSQPMSELKCDLPGYATSHSEFADKFRFLGLWKAEGQPQQTDHTISGFRFKGDSHSEHYIRRPGADAVSTVTMAGRYMGGHPNVIGPSARGMMYLCYMTQRQFAPELWESIEGFDSGPIQVVAWASNRVARPFMFSSTKDHHKWRARNDEQQIHPASMMLYRYGGRKRNSGTTAVMDVFRRPGERSTHSDYCSMAPNLFEPYQDRCALGLRHIYSPREGSVCAYTTVDNGNVYSLGQIFDLSTTKDPTEGEIAEALEDPSLSAFHRLKSFSKFQVQITKRTGR